TTCGNVWPACFPKFKVVHIIVPLRFLSARNLASTSAAAPAAHGRAEIDPTLGLAELFQSGIVRFVRHGVTERPSPFRNREPMDLAMIRRARNKNDEWVQPLWNGLTLQEQTPT